MIIAEQLPTKLVQDAVKNTNLKIMHRLTAEDDRRYLGETMGFDESQMRFATRLQTGEALAYSDEFAEATHVTVTAGAAPLRAPAGWSRPLPAAPFGACDRCRCPVRLPRCRARHGPRPGRRQPDQGRCGGLEVKGLAATRDRVAGGRTLLGRLRAQVAAFPALPSAEPGRSDAAYCLFLHALAVRTMRFSPSWPAAVATASASPT